MNIIFAGTPDFAVVALDGLINSSHSIKAVYTQPDRPAGRGLKIMQSPVKQIATFHDLVVYQPTTLRDEYEQQLLFKMKPDLIIVVAYGLLLPKRVLQIPRFGCINIHASLLPRWRGAAPIQRAILAGDEKTGVTIMQMDETLDTGPILYQLDCPISETDNSQTLHDRLALLGSEALLATLDQWTQVKPKAQDQMLATYANKILKQEAAVDWTLSASDINRKIRAFNPWPIAHTHCDGRVLRLWEGEVIKSPKSSHQPGEIVSASKEGLDIMAGEDKLRILKLQLPGGRVLSIGEMLNARRDDFAVGKVLL